MTSYRFALVPCLGWLLCGAALATPPETLKLSDLVNRPDRLPRQVTLKTALQFAGGGKVKKGQKVTVLEFNGAEVGVDAGKDLVFGVAPSDCDLLDAANKAWARLTPAQRAVEPSTLAQDPSLWPEKVKCLGGLRLDNGTVVQPGTEVDLVAVMPDGVHLYLPEGTNVTVDLGQTDAVTRARDRVLVAPEKRPSRIAGALRGIMVDASGKPADDAGIAETKVFALYYGASWCPPCRKFSPEFVKFVNKVSEENPHLTVVLMSNDKADAEMYQYMKEEKMPWNAVPLAALDKSPVLLSYTRGGIPQLAIVDRHGKILSEAYNGQRYLGPMVPMQALSKLLDSGAAK